MVLIWENFYAIMFGWGGQNTEKDLDEMGLIVFALGKG
jgi:hypothetical protein